MKIIISPAKKMNANCDIIEAVTRPVFIEKTRFIMNEIKKMSLDEAKCLWRCNDKLAQLNYDRYIYMNIENGMTPAMIAYEGLKYQHIAPEVFTYKAIEYVQKHLRILSGFYGVLKPLDGVTPYRLEMQAKLEVSQYSNLYDYWGDSLYREVKDNIIINLASKEYSVAIERFLNPEDRFITIEFGELVDGKVKQKGTFAKMARGEMVRFMAENNVASIEDIKAFQELGLNFSDILSDKNKLVFVKK